MAVSREIQNLVAKGDMEAIEDAWLTRLDEDASDLDYFVGVARTLVGQGQPERAASLLEILEDQLAANAESTEDHHRRLELLRRTGKLFREPEEIHGTILETLKTLHGHHTSYEGMVKIAALDKAITDTRKNWDKMERFETLVQLDTGTVVWMQGKGSGKVVEVNLPLKSFKIDFDKHQGLMVGFRAAGKMLKVLDEDHILRRKKEDPEALKALVDGDPAELLRIALESYDEPMTAAEVKEAVGGVVPPKAWTRWWAAARKHPQVLTAAKGRQSYSWAASSQDAVDAAWVAFQRAEPRKKLDALRREGDRDATLRQRMAASLIELGAQNASTDPSLALEIFWALERASEAPEDPSWGPDALLSRTKVPAQVALGILDKGFREKAYEGVRQVREDWMAAFLEILGQEDDPRLLDLIHDALSEDAPKELKQSLDRLIHQPRKNPGAFTWLAERASQDENLAGSQPLAMLRSLLGMLVDEDFVPYRVRLRSQVETGGTVPRILGLLNEEQARQADQILERAAGLEDFERQPLRTSLELRFASLEQESEAPLYALAASIETKREELVKLRHEEIPANRKAIEEARALGDLRENFEYKSARQRHEYLNARLASLAHDLSRAQPIDLGQAEGDAVRIGTRVTLKAGEETRTLTILGPWESDPDQGCSPTSPSAPRACWAPPSATRSSWAARPSRSSRSSPTAERPGRRGTGCRPGLRARNPGSGNPGCGPPPAVAPGLPRGGFPGR